jgi:hypothetical protein
MKERQSILAWAVLIMFLALFCMSAYSAFIGPYESFIFFNSIPVTAYWCTLLIVLFTAYARSQKMIRSIDLPLIYLACIITLSGFFVGSVRGHNLINRILGHDKFRSAEITINVGQNQNEVLTRKDNPPELPTFHIRKLPFAIRLWNFRIEYYCSGQLLVGTPEKQYWQLAAWPGLEYPLDPNAGSIKILNVYKNFRTKYENGKVLGYDSNEPGSNPAVWLQYNPKKGPPVRKFIFSKFPNPVFETDNIYVEYIPDIKDLYSEIMIIKDDEIIARKTIEINKPLHFSGYHFYLFDYDAMNQSFITLEMISDTGLYIVYCGFILLCIGIFWRLWLKELPSFAKTYKRKRKRKNDGNQI